LSLSLGEVWTRRLERGLRKIANDIKIEEKSSPSPCPGAYDVLSGEYDPRLDRIYHQNNPGAAVCTAGLLSSTVVTRVVKGFHFPDLNDADKEFFSVGPLESNEAIFLTARDQLPEDIARYEWPKDSAAWWRIEEGFPKSVQLNNVKMFYYCKSVQE
jgi:hypothetical protein